MDDGMLSGVVVIVLMITFVGIVAWAWSPKRDFEDVSRLPLEEDGSQPAKGANNE